MRKRLGAGPYYAKIVPVWFDGDWPGGSYSSFKVTLPVVPRTVICTLMASTIGKDKRLIDGANQGSKNQYPSIPRNWTSDLHQTQWVGIVVIIYTK
ncbi:hypothetical protein FACS1894184_17050 [Clostridia bacterium]|nr:hypothetical protein FACS1894184_17050 [Clostridia bacterium]